MLALPAPCAGLASIKLPLTYRQPFRLYDLPSRKGQTHAASTSACCYKSRRGLSHITCQTSSSADAGSSSRQEPSARSALEKAALFSFAPLAVALPVCFGHGGGNGHDHGSGGDGGDGHGPGGSGQGDSGRNVIADIAQDDDEDEEEEEEDDDEDDEEEEDDEQDEVSQLQPSF